MLKKLVTVIAVENPGGNIVFDFLFPTWFLTMAASPSILAAFIRDRIGNYSAIECTAVLSTHLQSMLGYCRGCGIVSGVEVRAASQTMIAGPVTSSSVLSSYADDLFRIECGRLLSPAPRLAKNTQWQEERRP